MFRRLVNLIKGMLGLAVGEAEKAMPEALIEVEKENLRKQMANYNQGLASHAGLCERLIEREKTLTQEEAKLRATAGAQLRAGNREAAGRAALRLQQIAGELAESRAQLDQAERTYRDLTKARDQAIAGAKAKIEALRSSLSELKVQRATAELSEMASGMISQIGSSGDTLNRLQEMVEEEWQKAAGRARVARDTLSTDAEPAELSEAEQRALADLALADFAAKEGIALDAPQATGSMEQPPAKKSMGPEAG